MTADSLARMLPLYRELLEQCREIYLQDATACAQAHPQSVGRTAASFTTLMDDLHRGLVIKIFIDVAAADRRWSLAEQSLATELIKHVWGRELSGSLLQQAVVRLQTQANSLTWQALLRPFVEYPTLRVHAEDLRVLILRLANLVARIDRQLGPDERDAIERLEQDVAQALRPVAEPASPRGAQTPSSSRHVPEAEAASLADEDDASLPVAELAAETLEDARAALDQLVGMSAVKQEVRTLVNYLELQRHRAASGLPRTELSLHTVFTGNPGTGKTTVARILGRILAAMGVLRKGHVVETDRGGLVAEYAGQTAVKVHKRVDEALDGVLFIDEAYSLVSQQADDAYGHEALQTLLKRIEDDRARLVVILAGYPWEMEQLLQKNPGLSSRFTRQFHFEDYGPQELAQIFEAYCTANHYELANATRPHLLAGFRGLYRARNAHFGNGRLARNIFEDAVRRLANRIAGVAPLTRELLTQLTPEDCVFPQTTSGELAREIQNLKLAVTCPGCQKTHQVTGSWLGRRARCPQCQQSFAVDWGDAQSDSRD